ncbi:MAG: PGPGW domain-containing protein [Acidimicrobiia bacterium]|nr:PGPGW domain-containing protein [Acidimicrobiia bacterium]
MDEKRRPMVIRVVLIVVGATVTLLGLAGLVLPIVPGWVLIFAGLAILASEFVWARRLLDNARAKVGEVASKLPATRKDNAA